MSDQCAESAGQTPMIPRIGIVGHLRRMICGRDNQTLDLGRLSWAVSTIAILVLAAWHERHAITVSLQELGMSLGAVVAAHGAALGLKAKTEPGGGQ